jgi:cytochrome c oxidase assembly factor CtaG
VLAWLAFVVATLAWHVPALYELALQSHFWHHVQHLCFLSTGVLFWWPVVQPWPSRPRWPRWAMIPYLLLADIQNTALSAALIFSERVLYPTYLTVPHVWGISALDDQAAAGVIMWVPGSLAYLVPVGLLVMQICGRIGNANGFLTPLPRGQGAPTLPHLDRQHH